MRLSLIFASLGMLDGLSFGRFRSIKVLCSCSGESERSEAASSLSLEWSLMVVCSVLADEWERDREGIYL